MPYNTRISEYYLPNSNTGNYEKHHLLTEVDAIEDTSSFVKTLLKNGSSAQDIRNFIGAKEKNIITAVPTQNGTVSYNGTSQSPNWNNYDTIAMTISGTTSAINVGTYTVTFTPKPNYQWSDKTITAKSTIWTIDKAQVTPPEITNTVKTYNGQSQVPTIATYDNTIISVSGDTSATNAGTYTITISLLDTDNYKWSDNTTAPKTVNWTINRATISTVPSQSGTLTYNTTSQSPTWSNYDSNKLTIDGTTTAINAGTYTAVFTPKSNYKWNDESNTDAKNIMWSIGKATCNITLSKNSISLNSSTLTDTFTITRPGDGTISVSSSSSSIATVTLSGNTVTVTAVANSNAIITVSVAEGTNYLTASTTIGVSVQLLPYHENGTLNDYTWAEIQEITQAGAAPNYWDIGDRKAVTLNGTVRARTLSDYTWYCYILGFNHNASVEGNNTIHFQFGFNALTGGVHTCLTDWTGTAVYSDNTSETRFCMNDTNTNAGGWSSSLMRTTTIPEFKNCLPSTLKQVLKTVTKYTDNTGNKSNIDTNVTTTLDDIFLLAEYEIFGTRTRANQYEHTNGKQLQYAYYQAGNTTIMYNDQVTNIAVVWWERSPYYNNVRNICIVSQDNRAVYSDAYYSYGFAPCFVVG